MGDSALLDPLFGLPSPIAITCFPTGVGAIGLRSSYPDVQTSGSPANGVSWRRGVVPTASVRVPWKPWSDVHAHMHGATKVLRHLGRP